MCECFKIGGRFIAEDPDCYEHGTAAREREREDRELARERDTVLHVAKVALQYGTPHEIEEALTAAVRYLESL